MKQGWRRVDVPLIVIPKTSFHDVFSTSECFPDPQLQPTPQTNELKTAYHEAQLWADAQPRTAQPEELL